MALIALMVLLLASLTGLVVGRWQAFALAVAAVPACAVLLGPDLGLLAALAATGTAIGVQLHGVVADASEGRPCTL
jgi:hypothetical protein